MLCWQKRFTMFRYTDLIKGHAAFTRTQFRQTLGANNIQIFQNIVNTKLISKEALYLVPAFSRNIYQICVEGCECTHKTENMGHVRSSRENIESLWSAASLRSSSSNIGGGTSSSSSSVWSSSWSDINNNNNQGLHGSQSSFNNVGTTSGRQSGRSPWSTSASRAVADVWGSI